MDMTKKKLTKGKDIVVENRLKFLITTLGFPVGEFSGNVARKTFFHLSCCQVINVFWNKNSKEKVSFVISFCNHTCNHRCKNQIFF